MMEIGEIREHSQIVQGSNLLYTGSVKLLAIEKDEIRFRFILGQLFSPPEGAILKVPKLNPFGDEREYEEYEIFRVGPQTTGSNFRDLSVRGITKKREPD